MTGKNGKIEDLKGEMWRPYRNTSYYFSNMGRVKRQYKTAPERLLTPYRVSRENKRGNDHMFIKIHRQPIKMARAIYEAFNGPIPAGMNVVKKDGTVTNLELNNLVLMTDKQVGHRYGSRTKTRRLIIDNNTGKIYKGTREAAAGLHISRQTVSDYCNNKRKKPMVDIAWLERRTKEWE